MLGSNLIPQLVLVHNGDDVGSGTDAAVTGMAAVDMQEHGATRITAVYEVGTVAARAALDLKLQTSDKSNADFADVPGTEITGQALTAKKYLVVEADTNGCELKRYVRLARQRKTGASSLESTLIILSGLRSPGRSLTRGDTIAALVGQSKS